jgi:hypothetical protein
MLDRAQGRDEILVLHVCFDNPAMWLSGKGQQAMDRLSPLISFELVEHLSIRGH